MPKRKTVEEIVEQVGAGAGSEVEKAVALHDYVRDSIEFGFNMYFDATPPEYTLACARGHCNPKSRLMVALFRAAGLESHQVIRATAAGWFPMGQDPPVMTPPPSTHWVKR